MKNINDFADEAIAKKNKSRQMFLNNNFISLIINKIAHANLD